MTSEAEAAGPTGSVLETPRPGSGAGDAIPQPPTATRRRRLVFWTRLALGLGLLAVILLRVDLGGVTIAGPLAQAAGVGVVALLMVLAQLLSAVRWRVIMGPAAPPAGYLFRLYLIGNFFSLFLPSSIGGDAVRTVAAVRATGRPAATVSSVVADRISGVCALLLYLAIGALLAPPLVDGLRGRLETTASPLMVLAVVVLLGLGTAAAVKLFPRVRPMVRQAAGVFVDLARSPLRLLAVAGLAMAVQGLYIVAWWALGGLLGLDVPPAAYILAVPVVSLVAMLPVTLSGLGVREGAWLVLLAPYGVAAPDAVAFSLLFFVAFSLVGALGGAFFALRGTGLPSGRPSD